ncbi:MFS transporter [Iodidimonas sp. SYSU 1G8]|uniref:MFS transporter n=1 Tax=Iodidimonas sp. SYSU 1G8 TaxID=3133967 RepID=UPI0031FE7943
MTTAGETGPLRLPLFRALWIATIVSNVGTWMHDVGAGWLMTSLSSDPLMVALVQAATTLPMFLFALPGGALADIVDRRRLLLAAQAWSLLSAAALAVLTLLGLTDPLVLLALTFSLATAAALNAPAFQAIVPELVPRETLPQAVALNSLGVNISRAIGPALGGLIIAAAGPAAVFVLNAVSVLGVMLVLYRWRRTPAASHLPPEHFLGALRAGARYVRQSPELRVVLVRSIAFFLFASAIWALLPVIARRDMGLGPAEYGGLLAFMGGGAVTGAMLLPRLRRYVSANVLTIAASAAFALVAIALSRATDYWMACAVMAVAGMAWIAMLSSLNVAAQMSAPAWVKARALAVYMVVFQGAMTAGSTLWGALAAQTDVRTALTVAAAGQVLALAVAFRYRLGGDARLDLSPSMHWPAPEVSGDVRPDRGPVMVTVEYRIDPLRVPEFTRAMGEMRRIRRRDGAMSWSLYEDAARPGLMIETFVLESWLEHLRQHERVTHTDHALQDEVQKYHLGPDKPVVRHLIAPET